MIAGAKEPAQDYAELPSPSSLTSFVVGVPIAILGALGLAVWRRNRRA
jgi:hypothetical protein